jgi:predicted DNA-binding transcriptional regulator YafY
MRRADRLFRIVQRLRRRRGRGVVTARQLAEELEVSERTIYRDVQDLVRSGTPIVGEAGVGYALPQGYDLPPLMFSEDELEALVLGARIVQAWGDATLGRAADDALGKIEHVLPARLGERIPDATLFAPGFHVRQKAAAGLGELRAAIKERRKVRLEYQDREGKATARKVWPLGLFYWGHSWSLGAWCELRVGFRNFRLDRVAALALTDEHFAQTPGCTLRDLFAYYENEGRE